MKLTSLDRHQIVLNVVLLKGHIDFIEFLLEKHNLNLTTRKHYAICVFFFFLKILFFSFFLFLPKSPRVHGCIFFVVGSSSCGMWDAASAWFDEQYHVRAQDSNQRNTGPPAAERANLTTWPRGQPLSGILLRHILYRLYQCPPKTLPPLPTVVTLSLTNSLWLSSSPVTSPLAHLCFLGSLPQ